MAGLPFCMNCLKLDFKTCYGDHRNKNKCHKCQQELVEIDEPLVSVIIDLNKKGYNTIYCCSGHTYSSPGYIAFDKDYDLPTPECLLIKVRPFSDSDSKKTLRWSLTGDSYNYRYFTSDMAIVVEKLHEYVDKLPSIK